MSIRLARAHVVAVALLAAAGPCRGSGPTNPSPSLLTGGSMFSPLVVVILKSGERIPLDGLTPADAVALLRARGVTLDQIDRTVHTVRVSPPDGEGAR